MQPSYNCITEPLPIKDGLLSPIVVPQALNHVDRQLVALPAHTARRQEMLKYMHAAQVVSVVFAAFSGNIESNGSNSKPASNCRGSVEGSPSCADPAWSLWKGQYGNGFCCQVGLKGAFRYGDPTAGICGDSVPAGYNAAELVSQPTDIV